MRALALALAATAALAACGGSSGDKPRTLPAITASPSPTPAPTPSIDPGVPAAAKAATSAGAEAFAKFFYTQTKRAFEAKNPDLISAISAPGCTGCNNYVKSITKLRDNNERVDNFRVNVLFAVAPALTGDTIRVDVAWSAPGIAIRYDAQGREIFRDGPFKRVEDQVNLIRRGDTWLVAEIKSIRTRS